MEASAEVKEAVVGERSVGAGSARGRAACVEREAQGQGVWGARERVRAWWMGRVVKKARMKRMMMPTWLAETKAGQRMRRQRGKIWREYDFFLGRSGSPSFMMANVSSILIDAFTPEQSSRYDMFKRAKLAKSSVRKIVNQTLSQSVPPNVVTTISGYTKVFIGELIERARTVQEEWAEIHDRAVREAMAADANAKAAAKTTTANGNLNPNTQTTTPLPANGPTIKQEDQGPSPSPSTVQPPHVSALPSPVPAPTPAAAPAPTPPSSTFPPNPHRGQLLPQHLREALRRYKRAGDGGSVGFSGLSDGGLGARGSAVWGVRGVGGRGLFR